jgi:hypothetical protein
MLTLSELAQDWYQYDRLLHFRNSLDEIYDSRLPSW